MRNLEGKMIVVVLLFFVFLINYIAFLIQFYEIGFETFIFIFCSIFCVVLSIIFLFKQKKSLNNLWFISKVKYQKLYFWAIIIVGVFLRCFLLTIIPNGNNVDEISSGYEAYSLLKWGIDRNGNSYPVYLEAWGSGQNALLTYLTIPFVAIFGLNKFSLLIVSLILGIVDLFVIYLLVKKLSNFETAIITLLIFAICPWSIMVSRWGLESNLLPSFILFGMYFFVKAIRNNDWYLCLSGLFLGLSLYAYAISYIFVPLLLICLYIYMLKIKKFRWKSFVVSNIIIFIFALTLILFVLVNQGYINEFKIFGIFTVPQIAVFRSDEFTFSFKILELLFSQQDFILHNSIGNIGTTYIALIPVLIIGLIYFIKQIFVKNNDSKDFYFIIIIWLLVSIVVGFFIDEININKINIIWIPYIVILSVGIKCLLSFSKKYFIMILSLLTCLALTFSILYFNKNNNYNIKLSYDYSYGLIESIQFAESIFDKDYNDKIVMDANHINQPYMYALYANKTPVQYFIDTVIYNPSNRCRVLEYGHYDFSGNFNEIDDRNIYIIMSKQEVEMPNYFLKKSFGFAAVYYIE